MYPLKLDVSLNNSVSVALKLKHILTGWYEFHGGFQRNAGPFNVSLLSRLRWTLVERACPLRLRSALHRVDEPAFPFFYVKRGVVIDSHVPRRVPHRVTPDDKRVSYTTLTLTTSFHEDYKQRVDDTPREPPPVGPECRVRCIHAEMTSMELVPFS